MSRAACAACNRASARRTPASALATVPLAAIQHGPDGLFVYTVKPDHTVQDEAVEVSYQDATTAVVAKGLKGGQTVIVAGQSRLAPGLHVIATDVSKADAEAAPPT